MIEPPTSNLNRDTAATATAEQVIASLALVAIYGVLWRFETIGKAAAAVGFVVTLAVLSIVDVRSRQLPNVITAPLFVAGIGVNFFHAFTGIVGALEGAAVGYGLLWGANQLYRLRSNKHAIGVGDMKFAAAAGAWIGVAGIWQALMLAAMCVSVWGVLTVVVLRSREPAYVPFGPVIAGASAMSLVFPLRAIVG